MKRLMAAWLCCVACTEPEVDKRRPCEPIERDVLAMDEVAPNELSPQMMLDAAGGEREHRLLWLFEQPDTDIILDVAYDGGAMEFVQFSDSQTTYGFSVWCGPEIWVDVAVEVRTADGLLDESFVTTMVGSSDVEDASVWTTGFRHGWEEVSGSFDVHDVVPDSDEHEPITTEFSVRFRPTGSLSGNLRAAAEVLEEVEEQQEQTMTAYNANRASRIDVDLADFPVDVVGSR